MKIDDLLLLAEVQRAGSLSAGARQLQLPKATLSRRLSALEVAVGARLFVPGASRLRLTELGHQLAERAARHHEDIAETRRWLAARDASPRGELRVSIPAEFATLVLAESLASFCQRYPDVALDIDTTPRRIDLFNEPYDLALRFGPVDEPELIARPLMTMDKALFASPAYLAQRGLPQRPEDLAGHHFVVFQPMAMGPQRMRLGAREFQLDMRGPMQCNSIGLTLALSKAGAGIGVFSPRMAHAEISQGLLVPLLPQWHFETSVVTVVTASRRYMPAKTRALIDHLFETVPEWVRPAAPSAPPRPAP